MSAFNRLLIGRSPSLRAVLRAGEIAAATDVTVLVYGESGTGKELLARAIHQESRRADGPFIAINCAAVPEGLAESELFGHRRGAFTGADRDRVGHIAAASGGTLFLDEVAELPLAIQAKLLRVIEQRENLSVGASRPEPVDLRLVAATHRDLDAAVRAGRFREDLYFRLNVVPLQLPPLRQRTEDLPLLLQHLGISLAAQYDLPSPEYPAETLRVLQGYDWPGNVRELRNLCERMLVLFGGKRIGPDNLPIEIRRPPPSSSGRGGFELPAAGIRLEDLERNLIGQALERAEGNRTQAARLLGLSRDTLLYRLKKYALG